MSSEHLITGRKRTLIIVRRTLTEPKTAFAGVILEISFARFMVSIATFNEESVPPRPFCCWGLVFMIQTERAGEKTCEVEVVTKGANPNRDGRSSCHCHAPRTNTAI